MSKPIARVTLVVLISLAVIAGTTASARGWLGGASEVVGVKAHVVDGLQTNFNHDRSTASEIEALQLQGELYTNPVDSSRKDGGCHSEQNTNPSDF